MFAQALSIRRSSAIDVVVGDDEEEDDDRDRGARRRSPPRAPAASRRAPDQDRQGHRRERSRRPPRTGRRRIRPWWRAVIATGAPSETLRAGESAALARTRASGAMSKASVARRSSGRVGRGRWGRCRIELRRTGPVDRSRSPRSPRCPTPPPAWLQAGRSASSRQVLSDLRIAGRDERRLEEVGGRRVREIAEREDPADDRDDVARIDPGLRVVAVARTATASREVPPRTDAGRQRSRPRVEARVPHRQQRRDLRLAVDARPERRSRPRHETGRIAVPAAALLVEAVRHVEPGVAREDADGSGLVANAEPDGAFLAEDLALVIARVGDARAVVQAGRALEWRDQRQLDRLRRAADEDLADGDRGDPRRGDPTDPAARAVVGEPADEQEEAARRSRQRGRRSPGRPARRRSTRRPRPAARPPTRSSRRSSSRDRPGHAGPRSASTSVNASTKGRRERYRTVLASG